MNDRRLVGIDLGIASVHTVRVLDGEGNTVAKRKAWPTVESLTEVEAAALAGCPSATVLRWWWNRQGRRGCRCFVRPGCWPSALLLEAHGVPRGAQRHA
jgi:hypothetical protein